MTVMQFSASRQKLVPSTFTLIYLSCILLLNPCTRELTTQLVFLQTYLNLDSTCNFTENFSLYFSKNTWKSASCRINFGVFAATYSLLGKLNLNELELYAGLHF